MSIERVVVAGNETEELRVICEALAAENLEVDQLHTVDELMERAGRDPADVVFLDLPSLQAEPDSLLHGLRMVAPQMRAVLIIDRTQVKAIVGAVRAAGGWYLVPPALPGEITALVACLRTQSRLEEENRYLRSEQEREYDVSRIVNIAPLMQEVLREVARAARSEEPVFLVGEPGTGKQLLAYTIHRTSPRGARCFVKVDLATSPRRRSSGSCLVTSAAPSRAPSPDAPARSNWQPAEPSSCVKSSRRPSPSRPGSFG